MRKSKRAISAIEGVSFKPFREGGTVNFNGGDIEVCVGYREHNGFGQCDRDATDELARRIEAALPGWCIHYWCGYGAAVICKGNPIDRGDWGDPSSRWHY